MRPVCPRMPMMVMTDNKFAELKDAAGTLSLLRLQLSAAPGALHTFPGWKSGRRSELVRTCWEGCAQKNYLSPGYRDSFWWLFTVHSLTAWRLTGNLLWVLLGTPSNLKIRTSGSSWRSASSPGNCSPTQRSQRSRYPLVCQKIQIQRRRSSGRDPRCVNTHPLSSFI